MFSSLTPVWNRGFAMLGRASMYRVILYVLGVLLVVSLLLSAVGAAVVSPLQIGVAAVVLIVVCAVVDAVSQRVVHVPWRVESSLITAGILLFVLQPTTEPLGLAGLVIAAAAASLSKYVLAWRGRHVFNPAAVGATVLTLVTAITGVDALGTSSWWVGTPAFGPVVVLLGVIVLWRTEKLRVVGLYALVALVVGVVVNALAVGGQGVGTGVGTLIWTQLWSSPLLFLGAFMLSEPLTLPPRRWQQYVVAVVVGALVGWAPLFGTFPVSLGEERAVLVGNLVAFAFAVRSAVSLTFTGRQDVTPTVRVLTFQARRGLTFAPGQYVQLEVPHHRPDARGTRREFSIASAPEDLPDVRIAFRVGRGPQSSFKKALAAVQPGQSLSVTGVWGDFVLPHAGHRRILMVAAGIGVTPFVSQLRHLTRSGRAADVVVVYVASVAAELAFRQDLQDAGVPVVVFTRDEPAALPANWTWAGGTRLDAAGLARAVPDLTDRHAYVSGPARLIADLAPALEKAKSVTSDAFSGY